VIVHPALSTYGHEVSGDHAIWFGLLFSALMLIAMTTWGYFRVQERRAAKAARSTAAAS
jgi:hypothetical protein